MNKRHLAIIGAISFVLNCLTGCAHAPVTQALPPAASHVGVDQAVAAVHDSQQHAVDQVTVIEKKIADPALKQDIVDLHSTITDLGFKLDDATAKIVWYEKQYADLYSDNATTHQKLDWYGADDLKHIDGEAFWRKRAQVILYALAIAFGWWFYGEAKKMCVSPVSGWIGLVIPFAAAALGAAVGYAFGLYVLGWLARFLP